MKKSIILLAALAILATGCASHQNVSECVTDSPAGFWLGLWHGIITPISFIGSLFFDSIDVYSKNNTGGWYDFGFLLGVGGLGRGLNR